MTTSQAAKPAVQAPALSVRRRNWMLCVLTLVGVCSSTDRAIVATILDPVKHEFALSDSQLGLMAGFAFSLTYALVALPAGAIADRVNRRKLIAGALAVWTVLTAITGLAQSYALLLISRMGVGGGEAAGQPAVMSSVADLFPPERRATAISIYYMCMPASLLLAGALGGYLAATYGWRVAVAAVAAPGLLVSLILLFCPDIPRAAPAAGRTASKAPGFGEVLRFIAGQKALLHLIVAVALVNVVIGGLGAFGISFFIRQHHMSLKTLGPLYGLAAAAISLVVILASGFTADRLGKQSPERRLWLIAAVLVIFAPVVIAGCFLPQPFALPCFLGSVVMTGVWMGPATGTAQNLARADMRSTVAAILFVTMNFIGVGLGPLFAGFVSDTWAAHTGSDGLRAALVATAALSFWSALHFHLATRTLAADMARAEAPSP